MFGKSGSILWVSGAIWMLTTLGGCSDHSATPSTPLKTTGSAVLTDRAKVLDPEASAELSGFTQTGDQRELDFRANVGVLNDLASGDVLIAGPTAQTPAGALVVVDQASDANAGFVVQGHAAALGDAFEELHIAIDGTLTAGPTVAPQVLNERVRRAQQALGTSVAISISSGSDGNTVALDGSLALDSDLGLTLDFDFSKLQLDQLNLSFTGKETFLANLTGHGQETIDETVPLGSIPFAPITVLIPTPVGAVPVVLTPEVELQAGLKGGISGDLATGVTQRASFTAGVGYKDGSFAGFSNHQNDFDFEPPTYGASANIRAWAGPKLDVLIYGAVGPFAGVEGFVEASASVEGPPPCVTGTLDAGLTAIAGMSFLADYSTTLFDARKPLASFDTCSGGDPNAARPATTWARTYARAGSDGERAQAVLQVSDGGYFVLGESSLFQGTSAFAASAWALRLDALGNVIWQRAYARGAQGLTRAAAEVPGGFVIAGTSGLIKLDTGGNVLWAKQYVTSGDWELTSLAAQPDGSLLLVGALSAKGRAFALKVDPEGAVLWARSYSGDGFNRARSTSDGGFVLSGSVQETDSDFYVVKLNADGNVDWQRALNNAFNAAPMTDSTTLTSGSDVAYDAIEKPQGGYWVVGESYSNFPIPEETPLGYYANAVLELDDQGELSGTGSTLYRAPSDSEYGAAYAVAVRANGSSIVVARRADTADDLLSKEDVLLIQDGAFSVFGSKGNDTVYSGTLSGPGRGMPLELTTDGGAVLALTSNSFGGSDQIWLLKLNRTASIDSPYRSSLAGSTFSDSDATSTRLTRAPTDVNVTAQDFTADLSSESTDATSVIQTP